MRHSREPFWWSLFSAGGVMSALLMPALIVATGFVVPLRFDDVAAYDRVHSLASFWLVRIALLGVLALTLIHCVHRVRHILIDLGFRNAPAAVATVCYGGALVGIGIAAVVLLRL